MPDTDVNATPTLSTEDWIAVAREVLIREGVDAVKIDRLARECNVTRGGFYWRFKSRADLLDKLIDDWRTTNTEPFLRVLTEDGSTDERFMALTELWLEEREYRPDYDTAVRAWARTSPRVAEVVHQVDDQRIDALRNVYVEAGYPEDEAYVRARIAYFHQVGYYAMGVRESAARRAELVPLYYKALFGAGGLFGEQRR